MPIHRQKKLTTADSTGSSGEQPVAELPDQQHFQQYLRELARSAMRVVLEGVMREELDELIGVGFPETRPICTKISKSSSFIDGGSILANDILFSNSFLKYRIIVILLFIVTLIG